jgi:hypothetical protein
MAARATTAQVQEALSRTDIMALATLDEDGGSWTSPVLFEPDASLHLYFASLPDAATYGTSGATRGSRQRSTTLKRCCATSPLKAIVTAST